MALRAKKVVIALKRMSVEFDVSRLRNKIQLSLYAKDLSSGIEAKYTPESPLVLSLQIQPVC